MSGAPLLASRAALRSGAGLVSIAAEESLAEKLELQSAEIMTLYLPQELKKVADNLERFISEHKVSAVVIGPGFKDNPYSRALYDYALNSCSLPMVVDGGALNMLVDNLTVLNETKEIVLTPHLGEFKRLVGSDIPHKRSEILPIAKNFAAKNKVTLILKGDRTLISHQGKLNHENETGNPGMATAGSGDVLSGILGAFLAHGLNIYDASKAAVYIHGLAGDLAADAKTQPALIAGDIIDFLPDAFKDVEERLS